MAMQTGSIKEYDAERNDGVKLPHGEHQPLQPKNDLQSSQNWLQQVIIVTIFVAFGAGHALAARISVDANGEIPYNTGALVAIAELIKLLVSLSWVFCMNRHELVWPWPYSWKLESAYLGTVAVLFAAQNQMNFSVIANLGATLYAVLGNLKIVWTCVFMRILMDKRFSKLQWTAVALLTASSVVIEIPSAGGENSHGRAPFIGLLLILISTLCSGIASVQNEIILKRKQQANDGDEAEMPFMLKNAVLYAWGVILNMTTWAFSHGSEGFFAGFNTGGVIALLALVGIGLSCACVLKYLDNMVRCFAGVFTVFATLLVSRLMPAQYWEDQFSVYHMVSLLMLSVALVMYSSYGSPNMWFLIFTSAVAALGVGCLCMLLDQLLQRHQNI